MGKVHSKTYFNAESLMAICLTAIKHISRTYIHYMIQNVQTTEIKWPHADNEGRNQKGTVFSLAKAICS